MSKSVKVEDIGIEESPVEFFDSVSDREYSFFLDSCMSHEKLGRYSYIGFEPFIVFRSKGEVCKVIKDGEIKKYHCNPFNLLEEILAEYKIPKSKLPFTGGAVGFLSYDLKDCIYDLPQNAIDDIDMPDCMLGFYDSVLVFDNLRHRLKILNTEDATSSSFIEYGFHFHTYLYLIWIWVYPAKKMSNSAITSL